MQQLDNLYLCHLVAELRTCFCKVLLAFGAVHNRVLLKGSPADAATKASQPSISAYNRSGFNLALHRG